MSSPSARWYVWPLRVLVTAAMLAIVVLAGQVPFGRASGEAVVRLALRSVNTQLEVCRERSEEELAALPVHMRRATVCEGVSPTYRLTLRVDGEHVLEAAADAGGVRGDRPLIVDQEVRTEPGRRRLQVEMVPLELPGLDAVSLEAWTDLPRYHLDQTVDLVADRITLVLLDQEDGQLKVYEPTGEASRQVFINPELLGQDNRVKTPWPGPASTNSPRVS